MAISKTWMIATSLLMLAGMASAETGLKSDAIYKKNCAKCHGKTAEGRHFGGPSLVDEKVSGMSAEDLRTVISNGKGRMPKYSGKLKTEDIDQLVQEIKSGKK